MMRETPHAGKDRLASTPVHPTWLPVGKALCRSGFEGERQWGRRLRFRRKHLDLFPPLFHGGSNPAGPASPAESRYDTIHIRQIFQDLEPHRGIARDRKSTRL